MFIRLPRSLICCADSSPEAYRTRVVLDRRDATSSINVDLPTPGSPPSRMSAPATTPPPSTRSNSAIPVGVRGTSAPAISSKAIGAESHERGRSSPLLVVAARSSTSELQALHDGQRPIHFGEIYPHCWQAYWVLAFKVSTLPSG